MTGTNDVVITRRNNEGKRMQQKLTEDKGRQCLKNDKKRKILVKINKKKQYSCVHYFCRRKVKSKIREKTKRNTLFEEEKLLLPGVTKSLICLTKEGRVARLALIFTES